MAKAQLGVPIKLLHEAEGHTVSVELRTGEIYRGHLEESEDTMNIFLRDVKMTAKDGRQSHFEQLYIRGSQVKYFVLPEMLKNSPVFRNVAKSKAKDKSGGRGRGRGR